MWVDTWAVPMVVLKADPMVGRWAGQKAVPKVDHLVAWSADWMVVLKDATTVDH